MSRDDRIMRWFDSHCHLDFEALSAQRDEIWSTAQLAGVSGLIIPGVTLTQSLKLPEFCQSRWHFAQGLHPYFLSQCQPDDLLHLEQAVSSSTAIAVGEIGIDSFLIKQAAEPEPLRHLQWQYFRAQVDIAKGARRPLILHIRGAHDEVSSYLKQQRFSHGGIVHAFSGSQQQARRWLDLGFKLGIGGAMTYPRAKKLRTTIRQLPLTAWLLETDAPDMRPAFLSSAVNTPAVIPLYGYLMAHLCNVAVDDLALQLQRNLKDVFPEIVC